MVDEIEMIQTPKKHVFGTWTRVFGSYLQQNIELRRDTYIPW